MGLTLLKPQGLTFEDVKDFRYAGVSSILMPSSKILIGTQGKIDDAVLYESANLTFDFGNGIGDNGLDAGVEASNQWYALYAVPKAGTKQYVLKASANAPHAAGGTGPSGFTKYRYLGIFRNGPNVYNSLAEHNSNDICIFTKNKNHISFQGYHTTGGGLYPKAQTHTGVSMFIANTSTNTVMLDRGNGDYLGFTGNSPAGAAKLPYIFGRYRFAHYMNVTTNSATIIIRDSGGNDRDYIPLVLESISNTFHITFDVEFSSTNWQTVIYSNHAANNNMNRGLLLQGFEDPFTVGGI